MQFSVPVRNARANAVETEIGASAVMEIRSGAKPATCADADTGTVLATINLPADWMAAASNGVKAKSGTWQDLLADADGDAAHYRVKDSGLSACHIQGTVGVAGSGADLIVDNTSFAAGQPFTVTSFSWTEGNA